jgi:hypothetical protein
MCHGLPDTFGDRGMVSTENYGLVSLHFWEVPVMVLYIMLLGVWFSRTKNKHIGQHPEYRWYLWGFYAKMLGGLAFSLVYFVYYGGGDTVAYFYSAIPLVNLLARDPVMYLQALLADNTMATRDLLFDNSTGYPYGFVYIDPHGYFLSKLLSPLAWIAFKSYLVTMVLVVAVTYEGVWRLFRTLRSYYPSIEGRLAFAVLFMPSSLFWGSGIIKDTFTFSAVCWFVHLLDELVFRKRGGLLRWAMLLISAWVMVMLKPYVFMALFPATMLWVFHARVQRIRNQMLRVMVLPLAVVTLFALWFVSINALGDELGKFSLDRALDTIVITQADLKRGQYGTNYFDLGPIEPTWSSVLSKFPVAVLAGLFRPAIFEVNNVMMLFSGLENLLLASLAAYILFRSRVVHFFTLLSKNAPVANGLCVRGGVCVHDRGHHAEFRGHGALQDPFVALVRIRLVHQCVHLRPPPGGRPQRHAFPV